MPFSFKMSFLFGSRNSCTECINPKCWLCIWCFLWFLLVQIPTTINLNLNSPSLAESQIKIIIKSICSRNKPTGNLPKCIPLPSCLCCLKTLYALNSRIIRYFVFLFLMEWFHLNDGHDESTTKQPAALDQPPFQISFQGRSGSVVGKMQYVLIRVVLFHNMKLKQAWRFNSLQ